MPRRRQLDATVYTERYANFTIVLSWVNLSKDRQWRAEVLGHEFAMYDKTYALVLARAQGYIAHIVVRTVDDHEAREDFAFVQDMTEEDEARGLWTVVGVGVSFGLLALLAYAMKPKPSAAPTP
jgi:hypothetical protein